MLPRPAEERLIARAHLTRLAFLRPLLLAGLGVALGVAASSAAVRGPAATIALVAAWLLGLIAAGKLLGTLARYLTADFHCTTRRVVMDVGLIRRQTLDMPIHRVESIAISQGLLGGLCGYGTLTIHGTGGAASVYHDLANPYAFSEAIQQQIAISAR